MLGDLVLVGVTSLALAAAPGSTDSASPLAGSWRFERAGWIYVHVEGAPEAMGYQHGHHLAPEVAAGLKATRSDWEEKSGFPWSWLVARSEEILAPRVEPAVLAELGGMVRGLADRGVTVSLAELIAYNGQLELMYSWWPLELKKMKDGTRAVAAERCSAFIATGSWTADGGVVLGHNTQQGYQEVLPRVILDLAPDRGHRILMQTSAGWVHSGTDFFVTDAGLVGAETTLTGIEGFEPAGIPEFVRMRRATQDASDIDGWVAMMRQGNNGGYANAWLLGDVRTGEIARLELGLRRVSFERTRDGAYAGSNVAESVPLRRLETSDDPHEIRRSGPARRLRWRQLLAEHRGRIDLERAKAFEGDHRDTWLERLQPGSRTLCRHGELDRDPAGLDDWSAPWFPGGAVDAKVVDTTMARGMSFAARWGSGCGRAFDAPAFLARHPQYAWMGDILESRPSRPWTVFRAGDHR